MNTIDPNLLNFEFQSPKRNPYTQNEKEIGTTYMEKAPSFSNVRNLNERIPTEALLEVINQPPGNNEENVDATPENSIHKIPETQPAYVNKPHDYFAELRKEIGIPYQVGQSRRRVSPVRRQVRETRYASPVTRRQEPGEIARGRVRGCGSRLQANGLGMGNAEYYSPSPRRRSYGTAERRLSPNTISKRYYEATYNYFSTEYCDKAHIAGLLQQIKSLEQENMRLGMHLNHRLSQLGQRKV